MSNPTTKHVLFSATDFESEGFSPISPNAADDRHRPGFLAQNSDQVRIHGGGHDAIGRESLDVQRQWRSQSPPGS